MIKVVFFDLGSTLLYSPAPWPPVFEQANRAMLDVFRGNGMNLIGSDFLSEIQAHLDEYYAQREDEHVERTWMVAMREFLDARGYEIIPDSILRTALDAFFAVTQTNWVLEEDTHPTLGALREAGFRLGMISNASDDANVQQLIDRWEMRLFFEFIITSAACGIRKPRPEIYLQALQHFDVPAVDVAMVGDRLETDVLGANNLGIFSIWITRRAAKAVTGILPRASVDQLADIPKLLSKINKS